MQDFCHSVTLLRLYCLPPYGKELGLSSRLPPYDHSVSQTSRILNIICHDDNPVGNKAAMIMDEKVLTLKEAIQHHVREGMSIHISDVFSYPIAAIAELTRQFWDTSARFTLIAPGLHNEIVPLLVGGCVERMICAFVGDIYPTPGPNPVCQHYLKTGKVAFERWSMLSLTLRLTAGAMNVGYLPTRSLIGSDLANENHETFKVIPDPFGEGEKMGLVKALRPDITLIHGVMGDPSGNTIIAPCSVTGIPGVFASENGAVVTVEKIVPSEVLRKYSNLVKIPGYMVKSISEVPFGAHPWGLLNNNVREAEGYDYDYKFLVKGREASENLDLLKGFIKDWILDCTTHEDYLCKVGKKHLNLLKENYRRATGRGIRPLSIDAGRKKPVSYTPQEIRIYAVTMKIAKIIKKKRYPLIVAGIGIGNLASWIAKELLKRQSIHLDLVVDTGIIGYEPQAGDPFIFSLNNIFGATIVTGATETYTQFFQKGRNRTLGVLGSGQIDQYGNLNSTFIPPDLFLPGSGGANDIVSYADEILITMPLSKRRFVDRVPYVTCPGENVRTLISDLGVFEKPEGEEEFVLTEYFCFSREHKQEDCVRAIQEECGWKLRIAPKLKAIKGPPAAFMDILDAFDPQGLFREGFY